MAYRGLLLLFKILLIAIGLKHKAKVSSRTKYNCGCNS